MAAWRELHEKYYPVTRAFIARLGIQDRDTEDTCQEVFIRLFRSLGSFRGEAELKTWIYRLCVTEAARWRRRSRTWDLVRKFFADHPETTSVLHPGDSEERLRQRVQDALVRMAPGDRIAFVLYEFEGMSGREIAEIVDCPIATVWRRLHYARRTFRAAFALEDQT